MADEENKRHGTGPVSLTKTEQAQLQLVQTTAELVLDKHGHPLVPQPVLNNPNDPLTWPRWIKYGVLLQISLISYLALFGAALIAPAYAPLSEDIHQTLTATAYVTNVFVLVSGIAPLIWNPFANVFGRRPVYILSTLVAVGTAIGSGLVDDFSSLLALRSFNGIGAGVAGGLGSATVADMFFQHERGLYMGIFTVSYIIGGHSSPIAGGYIASDLTWKWCFLVPAIIGAVFLVMIICFLPETLFSRSAEALARPPRTWKQNFLMQGKLHPTRKLHLKDFLRPIQMLKYPSVVFSVFYYSVTFSFASILFIVTSAQIFKTLYQFQPYQTGLLLGIPLTVGSALGEILSGGFSDWVMIKRTERRGYRRAEDRLQAIWPGAFLVPLGIIIEGVCIQKKTHYVGVGFGIGIANFGLQIVTTILYSYTAECYKAQTAELGALLNVARGILPFTVGFYAIPLGTAIGYQNAWIIFAFIQVASFFPIIALMWKGDQWRNTMGPIKFHSDL